MGGAATSGDTIVHAHLAISGVDWRTTHLFWLITVFGWSCQDIPCKHNPPRSPQERRCMVYILTWPIGGRTSGRGDIPTKGGQLDCATEAIPTVRIWRIIWGATTLSTLAGGVGPKSPTASGLEGWTRVATGRLSCLIGQAPHLKIARSAMRPSRGDAPDVALLLRGGSPN